MASRRSSAPEQPKVDEARIATVRMDIANQNKQLDIQIATYRTEALSNINAGYQQASNGLGAQRAMNQANQNLLSVSQSRARSVFELSNRNLSQQRQSQRATVNNQFNQAKEQKTTNEFRVQGNLQRRKGSINTGVTF